MPDLRYLGKHHWTRSVLDDKGKFEKFEMVAPGETFSVDDDVAERFLQGPRWLRLFVQAGGPEDPNSEEFVAKRDIGEGGNYVSDDPQLEMGSTVTGKAVFVTEDENPHNYEVASPDEGWASDNAALVEEDEIRAEADKARDKARESRSSSKSNTSRGSSSTSASSSSSSQSTSPGSQRSEKAERSEGSGR
jgi:hypothetical protein